jgi:hypothetical protein
MKITVMTKSRKQIDVDFPIYRVKYKFLPDTVDPRGPKGK